MSHGLERFNGNAHTAEDGLGNACVPPVSGCTSWRDYVRNGYKVGPNYCPPKTPVAEHWIDDQNPNVGSEQPKDDLWWQTFNDPALDDLVQTAYRQNLTLRVACCAHPRSPRSARHRRRRIVSAITAGFRQLHENQPKPKQSGDRRHSPLQRLESWNQLDVGTGFLGTVSPGHRVGRRQTRCVDRKLR